MVMFSGHSLNAVNHDLLVKSGGGFDASEWFAVKAALKLKNPLINLPYVIDGERVISQSNACMCYLGRKLGLWGEDDDSVLACEQLLCEIMDLRNKLMKIVYGEASAVTVMGLFRDVAGKNGQLAKLELWLHREVTSGSTGAFLVGDKATAPDFHLWEMIDQYMDIFRYFKIENPFQDFPQLVVFHSLFAALPQNQRYLNSNLHRGLPVNNKVAAYGANLNGDSWNKEGQTYDWGSYSGLY